MGAGEEKDMARIQGVIDRLEQLDRNLRSKYEQNGHGTSPRLKIADSVSEQDELRSFIDEQEGLLEVMQDLGESKDKISQQERIISQAKQDLKSGKSDSGFGTRTAEDFTPSEVRDDEEAQIKQDFIDAQKERLGNMGRGTSQSAYMALESGIKRLEAELASGDTSEARNRPGQFFDDREGSKGDKYIGYRPNKEVAADIRRDLKSAVENGKLPEGLKFSVKMDARGSGYQSQSCRCQESSCS
jgi:hypothetical protein